MYVFRKRKVKIVPYKFEKTPINNPKLDKRVKLTDENKKNIIEEYQTGTISIRALARKYGVDRRLIDFTIFPEKKEKARQQYKERRKDGRYYDKDKHKEYIKKHRHHKKELNEQGLLGEGEAK